MVVFQPPGVSSLGNETLLWVPAIAVLTAMTVAEATATGAVNVSFAARGFSPGGDQGTSTDIRLGTKVAYENPGRFNPTIDDITYVYDPQAVDAAPVNKHYNTLIEGAIGYLVDIRGLDATTWAATAAQKYVVYPVQLGAQRPVGIDPTSEGGKFEFIQKPYVLAPGPTKGAIAA
jgi:hypothetical protein